MSEITTKSIMNFNRESFSSIVILKTWPDTLKKFKGKLQEFLGRTPPEIGKFAMNKNHYCACLSAGHFIVFCKDDILHELKGIFPLDICAITDVSHARDAFRLSGRKTTALLNKGLSIDIDTLDINSALQSSIQAIGLILLKLNNQEFLVFTYSSFSKSFYEWVIDSTLEYGYGLDNQNEIL